MEERNLAFGKINYIIVAVAVLLIVVGFVLMSGSGTTEETGFNPEIFSKTRIVVAPFVVLVGFIGVLIGIVYKKKEN